MLHVKCICGGWREMTQSTGYSSTRPGFNSQNPHSGSQLSVTQVPKDRMASSDFHRH